MFITIFVHSTKMMSTNKSHKNTSAFLCKVQFPDMRKSQLIASSSLHCNSESVTFSLWPGKWNTLLCVFIWYQLNRARLSPPAFSCVSAEMRSIIVIYTKSDLAFKADKLSVRTQPFSEWSITICWLQHHVRSRTCLSVLVPVTDSLGEF